MPGTVIVLFDALGLIAAVVVGIFAGIELRKLPPTRKQVFSIIMMALAAIVPLTLLWLVFLWIFVLSHF